MFELVGIIAGIIAAASVVLFGSRGLMDLIRGASRRRNSQPTQSLAQPVERQPVGGAELGLTQEIRYCVAADGVRLAHATSGQGYPVVKLPHWFTHLEFEWTSPVLRQWCTELTKNYQLIRYDQRGCGLSDWEVSDFSHSARLGDLGTVTNALGLDRFALIGISQSAAVAISYVVEHPEEVSHLILSGGTAQGWALRGQAVEEEWEAFLTLIGHGWGRTDPAYRRLFANKFMPDGTEEQIRWFDELQRVATSGDNAVNTARAFGTADVSALLPQLRVPTLVLHSKGDVIVPFEAGRRLATDIPGAHFVPLDSKNHLLIESEPAWRTCIQEIQRFLASEA